MSDERFYLQTTNPDTKSHYKISDLPVEYRKFLESKGNANTNYPIRHVNQIIRTKRMDGSEWLRSRGSIVGLDNLGNEVPHSFTDPEVFFRPKIHYELKRKDPKDDRSPMERVCVSVGINELSTQDTSLIIG